MKKPAKENRKITKGMPSAVLLSIAIHAALFFLAGMLVVFTVVKKKEVEFEPPKAVERPKMKLKKPKPRIKKSARPKKAQHILAKVKPADMPEIQLPELSGMGGDGMGEGIVGGFDTMPDLSEPTLFGTSQSIGNDLVGTFYDFKRNRAGRSISVDIGGLEWRNKLHQFLERDWSTSVFSRYYRSPQKLYATNLVVPMTPSGYAPVAFGDKDATGAFWMVHYKGKLNCPVTHTNGITFRFWAMADEFIVVRVDGEMVVARDYHMKSGNPAYMIIGNLWKSDSADSWKHPLGHQLAVVGDWITLEPGAALDMEILIGDNGGDATFFLAVEEEGEEYERNEEGMLILPAFRTTELSHDTLDAIYRTLPENEISLTNGPVFCDYDTSSKAATAAAEEPAPHPESRISNPVSALRTWTLADGRALEAEFINIFGGKVVLKDAKGKIRKIPKDRLSAEDVEHAELANPPAFNINFLNRIKHKRFTDGWNTHTYWMRPPEDRGCFGVQIKQTGAGEYNHELQVELFVIGKQTRNSKYILLDRQEATFNPAEQEQRLFEFVSDREVVLEHVEHIDHWGFGKGTFLYGEEYYGYLVRIVDARGKVIAQESSHKWLPKKLGNLEKLSAGNYMDDDCVRAYPDPVRHPARYY